MRAFTFALGLLCALSGRTYAQEQSQEEPAFGERGQWMLDGAVGVSGRADKWEQPPNPQPQLLGGDELHVWVSPSARVFVAKDLAVGLAIRFEFDNFDREDGLLFKATTFGANALLAYRIGLGASAFLLPELALGASYSNRSVVAPTDDEFWRGTGFNTGPYERLAFAQDTWRSATVLHAGLYLPFAGVFGPRFYAGVGPYAYVDYASGTATPRGDDWNIGIGIATVFGTWL